MTVTLTCPECGREFGRKKYDIKPGVLSFCGRSCASIHTQRQTKLRRKRTVLDATSPSVWRKASEVAERADVVRETALTHLRSLKDDGEVEVFTDVLTQGSPVYWRRVVKVGRTCQHPGCDTILPRYNVDDYCALHLPEHVTWEEVA